MKISELEKKKNKKKSQIMVHQRKILRGERTSEDISSDKNNENSLSNTQDFKIEENVAEIKEVVKKNPRITLW